MSDYGPYESEWAAEEAFDNCLNECYGTVQVAGYDYDPARVLKLVDPVAYREEFNNWLDCEITEWSEGDGQ